MSNSEKGVTIGKDKDVLIPSLVVERAYETYPHLFGYAAVIDGQLAVETGVNKFTPKDIMERIAAAKDAPMVCHFGEVTGIKDVQDDDAQPFTLLSDKDGNPILVCFIEGRNEKFKSDNGHTDAYNFYKEELLKTVMAYWDDVPDLEKLMNYLQKEKTTRDIASHFGDRGVVTFVNNITPAYTIQSNDSSKETEWGWMSDTYGIEFPADDGKTEEKKEDKKEEPKGKVNPLLARMKKQEPEQSPLQQDIKNAALAGDIVIDKAEDKMAHVIVREVGGVKLCFPTAFICGDKNRLKDWCNHSFGTCPTGYHLAVNNPEKFPGIPLAQYKPDSKVGISLKAFDGLKDALASAGAGHGKDTSTKNVTADMARPVASSFPIIPANMKDAATKYFKTVDMKSNDIIDPTTLQPTESKKPDFFEQFPGITLEKLAQATEARRDIIRRWPDMADSLFDTLLYQIFVERAKQPKTAADAATQTNKNPLLARMKK